MSRSTWACELKYLRGLYAFLPKCHAPRERVSWNWLFCYLYSCRKRHAPRERVSWNISPKNCTHISRVTLHVSVWVEIEINLAHTRLPQVTLHVSVWVEILVFFLSLLYSLSRSTWACELKSSFLRVDIVMKSVTLHVSVWVEIIVFFIVFFPLLSRSTWACELKYKDLVKVLY